MLVEKEKTLGGQLPLAATPPHKQEVAALTSFLSGELRRLDVAVVLGREADASVVEQVRPDAVVIATGSTALTPPIAGLDTLPWLTGREVLAGKTVTGKKVAVVGGGMVGCEIAEFLAGKGKEVTVLEMLPELALDAEFRVRKNLLQRLKDMGVATRTATKVLAFAPGEIRLAGPDGESLLTGMDAVVLCLGSKKDDALALALLDSGKRDVFPVGDCFKPASVMDAMHHAFRMAYHI